MLDMIQRIEFKTNAHSNGLQKKLKVITEDEIIFVKAGKTTKYYKTEPNDYVTLIYKKTNSKVPDMITLKDKKIVEKLELDNRIEVSASRD